MKRLFKYIFLLITIFLVTAIIVGLYFWRAVYRDFTSDGNNPVGKFTIKVIDRLRHAKTTPKITPREEETIQVLEGWTTSDIGQYFEDLGKWPQVEFLNIVGYPRVDYRYNKKQPALEDFSVNYSFLADKPSYYGLEGYLFPDTYRIYASSTIKSVVEKMLDNFSNKLTPQMRLDIKKQGKTIYEIVTMASIIEKEAPLDYASASNRDAKIISGIFWNRLKAGQGLESDATLSYIFGDNQPQHSGEELVVDSLYNTYKYRGLPPGPICNPGVIALEAAIYPAKTDYNYFLTPPGKDTVIYARTYEEHLQNKYKYLR